MVFPLTVVALAIAVMIGDGCCAYVSICLGRGDAGTARRSVGCAVVLSAAAGLLLAAGYLAFARQLIAVFGAANESRYYTDFAVRAFRICA